MFSFAVVSSSVESTRLNHLVCRDNGGKRRGEGKAREAARDGREVRRLGEERDERNEREEKESRVLLFMSVNWSWRSLLIS